MQLPPRQCLADCCCFYWWWWCSGGRCGCGNQL